MACLSGKTALITGASTGIGRAIAIQFASLKCAIVITGRNEENLQQTKQKCVEGGLNEDQVLIVIGDIRSEEFYERLIKETIEKFGKLDILINNAGIFHYCPLEQTKASDVDNLISVNVKGVYLLTQLSIPHLKQTKGTIVNVSSFVSSCPVPGLSAYSMTKAAIDQFTRVAALELAKHGIRVNAINAGITETELFRNSGLPDAANTRILESCKSSHPLGRPGKPEEIAKAIAFLAAADSSYVTGALLPVDGGRSVACPQ